MPQAARELKLSDVIEAVEASCASRETDVLELTALHEGETGRKLVAVLRKSEDGDINPSNVPEGYERAIWEASQTLARMAGAEMTAGAAIRFAWHHGERETVTVSVPPHDDEVVEILKGAATDASQRPKVLH